MVYFHGWLREAVEDDITKYMRGNPANQGGLSPALNFNLQWDIWDEEILTSDIGLFQARGPPCVFIDFSNFLSV